MWEDVDLLEEECVGKGNVEADLVLVGLEMVGPDG